jgi:hypothetical protein
MKKLYYLIVLALILGLVLTGCSLLSNVGQVPATEQSGIAYLTKSFSNLVGLWHFDEGSGTTADDSSGNSNDGTITGATYAGIANAMFGDALSFNGVGDYVEVSNSSSIEFEGKSNITMEAWVYPKSYHAERGIVLEHIAQYYLTIDKNGKLAVYFYGVSPAGYYISTSQVPLNTWTHIAATYNGSSVRLYINGEPSGVTFATGSIKYAGSWSNQPLRMGYERPGLTRYFHGIIDEVRIWDIALTEFQLVPVIVAMDIKPGSCPNPLNVKNQGVLPVAILGTENFDVNDIDPSTILLEGVRPVRWAFEDVATPPFEPSTGNGEPDCFNCTEEGPDGFLDLTLKFEAQEVLGVLGFGTMALVDESEIILSNDRICRVITLTCYLYDGTPISGEDTVLIIEKKK